MGTAANKVKDSQKYKLMTICHHVQVSERGKLDGVVFINFQIAGYASPALDLAFFLDSSTTGRLAGRFSESKAPRTELCSYCSSIYPG